MMLMLVMILFKSLREIAVPQGNPAEWVTEIGCGSRRHPGGTGEDPTRSEKNRKKTPAEPNKPRQEPAWNQQKGIQKSYQNRVRDGPWSLQNASGTHPEHTRATKMQKNGLRSQKGDGTFFQGAVLGRFWDPAGSPKSTKNGPGSEKVRPETAPEAFFCRVWLPVPFGVALRTDFWKVRPLKMVLRPQREHDFDKITVFKKTPKE